MSMLYHSIYHFVQEVIAKLCCLTSNVKLCDHLYEWEARQPVSTRFMYDCQINMKQIKGGHTISNKTNAL